MGKTYIQEKLSGTPGQVVSFKNINSKLEAVVEDLPVDSSKSIILNVTAPDNVSRVVITNGIYTYESDPAYIQYIPRDADSLVTSNDNVFYTSTGNIHTFILPVLGDWVVVINKGGLSASKTISIESVGTYDILLSYFNAYIDVIYDAGATCTCTDGITTLTAVDTSGTYRFVVAQAGDWVVQAVSTTTGQAIETVHVTYPDEVIVVHLSSIQSVLNDNSWSVIQAVAIQGTASNYWSIGDCKALTLNGDFTGSKSFDNVTLYAQIIGFNHNTATESKSKPTITFQLGKKNVTNFTPGSNNGTNIGLYSASDFKMQAASTNAGGWEYSYMRLSLLPLLKSIMSSDVTSCMMLVDKYTDNGTTNSSHTAVSNITATKDDLFLLSEYEVFGSTYNSNTNEAAAQVQYQYYANSGSKVRQRDTDTTNTNWWLRSPVKSSANYTLVDTSGSNATAAATTSCLISPAFVIGR